MDLLDEVGAKAVTLPGGQIASLLVDGSADLAVQLTSELVGFPGAEYIGPLPPELQMEMMFGAGIFLSSSNSESAVDFLEFLSQPQWTTIYSKNGMNQALN
jgi:molybdate transport system substrate-binding protein